MEFHIQRSLFEFEILRFELGAVSLLFEIIGFISLYHSLTTIIEVSSEETCTCACIIGPLISSVVCNVLIEKITTI